MWLAEHTGGRFARGFNAGGVSLVTCYRDNPMPLLTYKQRDDSGPWSAAGLTLTKLHRNRNCSGIATVSQIVSTLLLSSIVEMVYLRYTNEEVAIATRMTQTLRSWNAMPESEEWFVYTNRGWVPIDDATVGLFYDTIRKGQHRCQLPWSFPNYETLYLYDLIRMTQTNVSTDNVRRILRITGNSHMNTSPWQYCSITRMQPQDIARNIPSMGNIGGEVVEDDTEMEDYTVTEIEVDLTRSIQARTPAGAGLIDPRNEGDNAEHAPWSHVAGPNTVADLGMPADALMFGSIIRGIQNLPTAPDGMCWSPVEEHWWRGIPDENADFMLCKLADFQYELPNAR